MPGLSTNELSMENGVNTLKETQRHLSTFNSSTLPFLPQTVRDSFAFSENGPQTTHRLTQDATGVFDVQGNTENFTVATQLRDTGLGPDPEGSKADVEAYKAYLSQVKFKWMESVIKRRYVIRVLGEDLGLVKHSEIDAADRVRLEYKDRLKALKGSVQEKEQVMRDLGNQLQEVYPPVTADTEEARRLVAETEDMERELAMLRNGRPEEERMTIAEAEAILEDQTNRMQQIYTSLSNSRSQMSSTKASLLSAKRSLERSSSERQSIEKLQSELRKAAAQGGGKEIEQGCRWYKTSTELYMKLLGILTVGESKGNIVETGSVTDGKREVKIVYDLGREGKTATLRIVFSEEGEKRFLDAELLNSNEDISDAVAIHRPSGDISGLVQDVLDRVRR